MSTRESLFYGWWGHVFREQGSGEVFYSPPWSSYWHRMPFGWAIKKFALWRWRRWERQWERRNRRCA